MTERRRHSYRHPDWDYSSPGTYFITICADQKRDIFGAVVQSDVQLSELGGIVQREWLATPLHRPYVNLDLHVVMPNHFHGLLKLDGAMVEERPAIRQPMVKARSLGAIVRGFKSAVTLAARRDLDWKGSVWQSRFHDRIVRTDAEFRRIRDYIAHNPERWTHDRENPHHEGEDEFYSWLDRLPAELP